MSSPGFPFISSRRSALRFSTIYAGGSNWFPSRRAERAWSSISLPRSSSHRTERRSPSFPRNSAMVSQPPAFLASSSSSSGYLGSLTWWTRNEVGLPSAGCSPSLSGGSEIRAVNAAPADIPSSIRSRPGPRLSSPSLSAIRSGCVPAAVSWVASTSTRSPLPAGRSAGSKVTSFSLMESSVRSMAPSRSNLGSLISTPA